MAGVILYVVTYVIINIIVPLVALRISSVRALITSLGANNTMGSRLP